MAKVLYVQKSYIGLENTNTGYKLKTRETNQLEEENKKGQHT